MAVAPRFPRWITPAERSRTGGQDPATLVRYPNGFELLFVRNRSAPVLALDLWVRVGSADETPEQAGIAHLIEHMLFKGTERRPAGAFAREVEGVGGETNAFTTFDHTVYTIVVASRFAPLGIDILADAVFHPALSPEDLETEKQVVLEEIKRGRDLPHHYLSRLLFAELFATHPYGRPVIGEESTVAAFTREDCLSFLKRWYRTGGMTLVVAGDVDPDDLSQQVGEAFAHPGRSLRPPRQRRRREPRRRRFGSRFEGREVSETYFDLAFPGPAASDADVPALDVLMAVLGQGESSRLQHRIKLDRNLVRAVGAGAYTPQDPGLLYVSGVADPGRFTEAYCSICREVFRLAGEAVGTRELGRAKENIEADFVYQKETVQGQAQKAGFFHTVLGSAGAEEAYLECIRSVDPVAVQRVARKYFRPDRGALAVLHPAGSPPPITAARAAGLAAEAQHTTAPTRARGAGRKSSFHRQTLRNGARVLIKRNPDVPVVALRAAFLGGTLREPVQQAGAYHLLAASLARGTRSRDVFEIARAIDAISGQIDGFSGRNSFGLRGEFLTKHLEEGFELFADILCHPSFPGEEIAKVREDVQASLRLRKDNPGSYAFRLFEALLYEAHPFGRDVLGTPETVARLREDDLRRLFAVTRRPENLALGVAGDVEPDLALELAEEFLGRLEAEGTPPPLPAPPAPCSVARRREVSLAIEQSHVVVGFLGARLQDEERYALRVGNAILSGQGGRLFRRLRDQLGLAYAVSSTCVEGLHHGYIAGYVATAPASAEDAAAELLTEFSRLAAGEIDDAEMERAQRKLVGGFEIALQENAFQAAQMALDDIYGLGYRAFASFADRVFSVRRSDVVAAAQRYLSPERHVRLSLGP